MAHQPQEIARGTRADSSLGFTEVRSPRNEQAWLANPFQALRFLKPAYETYRKETPGREVTRQPARAVRPETWRSSWSPTSARGTLAFSARRPRPRAVERTPGSELRGLHFPPHRRPPAAPRRDHSPGCRTVASTRTGDLSICPGSRGPAQRT